MRRKYCVYVDTLVLYLTLSIGIHFYDSLYTYIYTLNIFLDIPTHIVILFSTMWNVHKFFRIHTCLLFNKYYLQFYNLFFNDISITLRYIKVWFLCDNIFTDFPPHMFINGLLLLICEYVQ